MPALSSMIWCISTRRVAIFSRPPRLCRKRPSSRRCSSWACAASDRLIAGPPAANAAAALPARAPKTSISVSEFDPRRLAPLMLTHAASPAAYSPGSGVAPWMSVWMPPIM
jgi:hypothetical protein